MGQGQVRNDWTQTGRAPWAPSRESGGYTPADAALCLGMAHVWLSEAAHYDEPAEADPVHFERFRNFVLGFPDGVPKTPQWAARFSGVPSYTIRALARQWRRQSVSAANNNGGKADGRDRVCPALLAWGDGVDLADLIVKGRLLCSEPATGLKIRRHTGAPGSMIGGTVYDYDTDEVIEGAQVTIRFRPHTGARDTMAAEEAGLTVTTDELGSFLVDGAERGDCRVLIEKEGYVPREWGSREVGTGPDMRDYPMSFDSSGLVCW